MYVLFMLFDRKKLDMFYVRFIYAIWQKSFRQFYVRIVYVMWQKRCTINLFVSGIFQIIVHTSE